MRKIVATIRLTLDGVMEGPGRPERSFLRRRQQSLVG